MQEQY